MSKIAEKLSTMPPDRRACVLKELCFHLRKAQLWDELEVLLIELSYLEARVDAGLVFELVDDYKNTIEHLPKQRPMYRILQLLGKALMRNTDFISRHPSTLFQCLWNSCWWYDCPDLSHHYPWLANSSLKKAPWTRRGFKLYELMETWRREKEVTETNQFVWLRYLRPPHTHINSPLHSILSEHNEVVQEISVAYEANLIASVGGHDDICIWNALNGKLIKKLHNTNIEVDKIAVDPSGKYVVSCHFKDPIAIWDIESGEIIKKWEIKEIEAVPYLTFSPDGKILAVSSNEKVFLVNTEDGAILTELSGIEGDAIHISFAKDGKFLAASSGWGTVCIWNILTKEQSILREAPDRLLGMMGKGHPAAWNVSLSSDGRIAAAACGDGTVLVWATSESKLIKKFIFQDENGSPISMSMLAVVNDLGDQIAFSIDEKIFIYETFSGELIGKCVGHQGPIMSLLFFSPNKLVSGGYDRSLILWDIESNIPVIEGFESNDPNYVGALAFSPDGDKLIAIQNSGGSPPVALAILDASKLGHDGAEKPFSMSMFEDSIVQIKAAYRLDNGLSQQVVPRKNTRIKFRDSFSLEIKEYMIFKQSWYSVDPFFEDWAFMFDQNSGSFNPLEDYKQEPKTEIHQYILGRNNREIGLFLTKSGESVSWLPTLWYYGTSHPSGQIWAGTKGKYIELVQLEISTESELTKPSNIPWYRADIEIPVDNQEIFGPNLLPGFKEVSQLSRWAQVAFATRCARYVYHLIPEMWPRITERQAQILEIAINCLEQNVIKDFHKLLAMVISILLNAKNDLKLEEGNESNIACFCISALISAMNAFQCAHRGADDYLVQNTIYTEAFAIRANPSLIMPIRGDFNRLLVQVMAYQWSNEDTFPLKLFLAEI
ncbi:MAG: hypothetical protein ILNGONEN_00807 [Syntrophorhabdaceae bacterium]|nr:hypothetical protein [Syntrophorhabdaceae bacterium]